MSESDSDVTKEKCRKIDIEPMVSAARNKRLSDGTTDEILRLMKSRCRHQMPTQRTKGSDMICQANGEGKRQMAFVSIIPVKETPFRRHHPTYNVYAQNKSYEHKESIHINMISTPPSIPSRVKVPNHPHRNSPRPCHYFYNRFTFRERNFSYLLRHRYHPHCGIYAADSDQNSKTG